MYVCLNWVRIEHAKYGKKSISQILLSLLFLFFSLYPNISKTVRGAGLTFCKLVGTDDFTCSDLSVYL